MDVDQDVQDDQAEEPEIVPMHAGGANALREKLHARMAAFRNGRGANANGKDALIEERRRAMRERRRKETKERRRQEKSAKTAKVSRILLATSIVSNAYFPSSRPNFSSNTPLPHRHRPPVPSAQKPPSPSTP